MPAVDGHLGDAPAEVRRALAQGYDRYLGRRNDRLTVGLVAELKGVGVRAVVLKGASTRYWLDLPDRPSGDVDLWTAPRDRRPTERVLRSLGYKRKLGVHADGWKAADRPPVDLHRTIPRLRVGGGRAWKLTAEHRTTIDLEAGSIDVLDRPAHLVHLAIHATQDDSGRSKNDLRRGVQLADEHCLDAAVALSRQLGAEAVVAWSLEQAGLPEVAHRFGPAEFAPNAPNEHGWMPFLRSPVHWEERRRRAARVAQMWLTWNAGRAWRVLTLRSVRVQRLKARLRRDRQPR